MSATPPLCPGCADPISDHSIAVGCLAERTTLSHVDGYVYAVCRCLLDPQDIIQYYTPDAVRERLCQRGQNDDGARRPGRRRRNGSGSIYQRHQDGRWVVALMRDRKRRIRYARSLDHAKRLLQEMTQPDQQQPSLQQQLAELDRLLDSYGFAVTSPVRSLVHDIATAHA